MSEMTKSEEPPDRRRSHPVDKQADLRRPDIGPLDRLEFLTDAIFGIVMTLIVLEIAVPHGPESRLPAQLDALVPTFLTYALTFVTLGGLWFGNRTQSRFIVRGDHPFAWLALLMLGLLALVPFSAGFLARFPLTRIAVLIFGLHLVVVFTLHGTLWLYASFRPWLLRDDVSAAYRRRSRLLAFLPAIGYAVATALGVLFPLAGLIGFLLVPLPIVTGLYYRGLARVERVTRSQ